MTEPSNLPDTKLNGDDDEISLIDLLITLGITLGERKKLLFGLPSIVAVLVAVYSLLVPFSFTAATTFFPPSSLKVRRWRRCSNSEALQISPRALPRV